MTHEELLAKVKFIENTAKPTEYCEVELCERNLLQLTDALQAVVKLHKEFKFSPANTDDFCSHCSRYEGPVFYPCPTIQAIEKVLE